VKPDALAAELAEGRVRGAYLVGGSEALLRDEAIAALERRVLGEKPSDFNLDRLDGDATTTSTQGESVCSRTSAGSASQIDFHAPRPPVGSRSQGSLQDRQEHPGPQGVRRREVCELSQAAQGLRSSGLRPGRCRRAGQEGHGVCQDLQAAHEGNPDAGADAAWAITDWAPNSASAATVSELRVFFMVSFS